VKTHCAAIHFPKELIRSLDVGGPIAPMRAGSVVEMSRVGYRWSEFFPCMKAPGSNFGECWMFPPDADSKIPVGFMEAVLLIGYKIRGFVNRRSGTEAKKEMGGLMNVAGQGLAQLEFDAKADLAKLGIFQNGQVGYFFDSTATCHLVMSQN
jgi:hypothetical protein